MAYTQQAEILRKQYAIRHAILQKRIKVPYQAARRLIGPDCAYHLYQQWEGKK